MKYLIWTPAYKETLGEAHEFECDGNKMYAARQYVLSLNYPGSICSVFIVECDNDWNSTNIATYVNFQLVVDAQLSSSFDYDLKTLRRID